MGSPPPMRGKVPLHFSQNALTGITPAYAGKSTGLRWCWRNRKDHPRLCGEKLFFEPRFHTSIGSPPPMRGKVVMSGGYIGQTRITPAYAGKREYALTKGGASRDHPRLCGEKQMKTKSVLLHGGSPPPMRGKVFPFCRL